MKHEKPCFHVNFVRPDRTPGNCDDHSGNENDANACSLKVTTGLGWGSCIHGGHSGRLRAYRNNPIAKLRKAIQNLIDIGRAEQAMWGYYHLALKKDDDDIDLDCISDEARRLHARFLDAFVVHQRVMTAAEASLKRSEDEE